ncbi:response regulator [Flavobacterium enshiense]|uniref:response regulator n=1 Tax=Flavobacterium enshiense TaxID=1341165 RepID=UPI00345C9334
MLRSKTICIIDDDPIYQLVTQKLIDKSGLFSDTFSFRSGEDAIHHLTKTDSFPDVILLDIEMPQMDAWDFLNEMTFQFESQSTQIKSIYIVSSSIATEDKLRAEKYDFVKCFLSKPIDLEKLKMIAEH